LTVALETLGSFPAARDFVMNELVTKADLALVLDNLKSELTVRLGGMIWAGIAVLAGYCNTASAEQAGRALSDRKKIS
jgi:hypothetical protein